MKSLRPTRCDRFIAISLLLLCGLPVLLFIGALIGATAGSPIVERDTGTNVDGVLIRRSRFRTAGGGSATFHEMGVLLRQWSVDDLPALWNFGVPSAKVRAG